MSEGRLRLTASEHSYSILQWCHTSGDLMDGVIRDDPGFLIGVVQITLNDVFNHFRNEALFTNNDTLKWKIRSSGGLARNHDFAEGGGREVNAEKLKSLNWEKR